MLQRGGEVVIQMLANVQQKTIQPLIQAVIQPGTLLYTDEYDIYARPSTTFSREPACLSHPS